MRKSLIEEIDLDSLSEETQDLMMDLLGVNEDLYKAMMADNKVFDFFINNEKFLDIFKKFPEETKRYLRKNVLNLLMNNPNKYYEMIKNNIENNNEPTKKINKSEEERKSDNNGKNENVSQGGNIKSNYNNKTEDKLNKESNKKKDNNKPEDKLNKESNKKNDNNKSEDKLNKISNKKKDNNNSEDIYKNINTNTKANQINKYEKNRISNQNLNQNNETTSNNSLEEFNELYFIIIIEPDDFEDIIPQVDENECVICQTNRIEYEKRKFYEIIYKANVSKNSKNCYIQLYSKKYSKCFKGNKEITIENTTIIFENLKFNSFNVYPKFIFNKVIHPPDLVNLDNFESFYYVYYSYLKFANSKFKEQLYQEGLNKLEDIKSKSDSKISINCFIYIMSFHLNNTTSLTKIISYFDIKYIEKNPINNDAKKIFNELLTIKNEIYKDNKNKIKKKFDTLITFVYLILEEINSAIGFISKSKYKDNIIKIIETNLEFFKDNIYNKQLLNFLLKNCTEDEIIPKNIIAKCLSFKDLIELIYENYNLYKKISFQIDCEKHFKLQNYGNPKEIIEMIIFILKNCKSFDFNTKSFINKYPNIISIISKQQRKELYSLIKNNNDPIKNLILKADFNEADDNETIINLIESFILWEYPDRYDFVLTEFNKINFQSMEKETFEKLKNVFKNFKFYSMSGVYDKLEYDKKFFFLILNKLNNIYQISGILWELFESNILYYFEEEGNEDFLNKYWELFSLNNLEDSLNNLFEITNKTFTWCIKNISNPNSFLINLENKFKTNEEKEKEKNESYIIKLYVEFWINYHNQNIAEYIFDYLKKRILKLDKESLEKILNIEDGIEEILQEFIQFKLIKQNFFEENSKNLELFKLINSIQKNSYIVNSLYYQKSFETINKIALELQTMSCTYHELLLLSNFSEDELKIRIEIL